MSKLPFQVWNLDRCIKKTFLCLPNLSTVIENANRFGIIGTKLVLENSGSEIVEDDVLEYYAEKNFKFILLNEVEIWSPEESVPIFSENPTSILESSVSSISNIQEFSTSSLPSTSEAYYVLHEKVNVAELTESRSACSSPNLSSTLSMSSTALSSSSSTNASAIVLFSNFKVPWDKLPKDIIENLNLNQKLEGRLSAFINYVVDELRRFSFFIPIKIFRSVAEDIVRRYPNSFEQRDAENKVISSFSEALLTMMRNRNNYLNHSYKKFEPKIPIKKRKAANALRDSTQNWQPEVDFESLKSVDGMSLENKKEFLINLYLTNQDMVREKETILLYMKECYAIQRSFFNNTENFPSIITIQQNWPYIFNKDCLYQHFVELTGINKEKLEKTFDKEKKAIADYFIAIYKKQKRIGQPLQNKNTEENILNAVTMYFKEDVKAILKKFPVNISNTWTLPHDGFTVFYRFFRDQISWFEADAVCQFHHANLVTVTNSVEFDASREFLRILDVTEPVWIGLMRSQNSDRFFWSNSKPLGSTSEYWAESLPVIDAPLCAVIDPVRDYRWHALRCGGPETASFLCEMNVPSWAEECVIRDMPSLTIQYMADSGTVEITKDCGDDEGIIHQVCRGKQDLDRIINSLICRNEKIQQEISQIFSQEKQNLIINSDLLDSHKKSIEIIKNIQTDNNEDNNINLQNNNGFQSIEKLPEQETENPVQKLIEQFDVEELMQADQPQEQQKSMGIDEQQQQQQLPLSNEMTTVISPSVTQKPFKRQNKKVRLNDKKTGKKYSSSSSSSSGGGAQQKQKQYGKNIAIEDMMMGDQPAMGFGDNDDLNEIQEPLPHTKKMLPQDLKHENDEDLTRDKNINTNLKDEIPNKILLTTTTTQSVPATGTVHLTSSEIGYSTVDTNEDKPAPILTTTITSSTSSVTTTNESNDDTNQPNGIISTLNPLPGEENLNIASESTSSSSPNEPSTATLSVTGEVTELASSSTTDHIDTSDSTTTTKFTSSHMPSVTTLSPGELKPTPAVTIGHPMHPQQPRSNIISEETAHQHIKETNDNHFIPPMLMVKSHYQSPKSGSGHNIEHQLDLQIVRKKSSPSDSESSIIIGSNEDNINHHLVGEHNTKATTTTTTTKEIIPDTINTNYHDGLKTLTTTTTENSNNEHIKSQTTDELNLENLPTTVSDGEKITITTLPTLGQSADISTMTSKSDIKLVNDKVSTTLPQQIIIPTATVTPNQIVEIKFANDDDDNDDSTENPAITIKSIPSLTLPSEMNINEQQTKSISDDIIIKDSSSSINTTPLFTSQILSLTTNTDNSKDSIKIDATATSATIIKPEKIIEISTSTATSTNDDNIPLKQDFPTILTTIVGGETTKIVTSTQETFKNLEQISTATTGTTVTNVDSKTFIADNNNNNFTIVVSSSESDNSQQKKQQQNNNNNNKQEHNVKDENSTGTPATTTTATTQVTTTTIKTLAPTKKIISTMKKINLKAVASVALLAKGTSSATARATTTSTTTTSPSSSSSIEMEELANHDETKKVTSDIYTSSDEENFQPHKPNRRRTLTKPETTSYLKKILG